MAIVMLLYGIRSWDDPDMNSEFCMVDVVKEPPSQIRATYFPICFKTGYGSSLCIIFSHLPKDFF
jgi:hypothetical protein